MCDIPSIRQIHDCIDELKQPGFIDMMAHLTEVLRSFNNVERLHKLALVVPQDNSIRTAEILINQALHLKKCLQLVPELQARLSPLISKKFHEIQANLLDQRYASMLNHIETVLNRSLSEFRKDSSSQLFQRIHCVQSGANELIDILRKTYKELTTQVESEFVSFFFYLRLNNIRLVLINQGDSNDIIWKNIFHSSFFTFQLLLVTYQ